MEIYNPGIVGTQPTIIKYDEILSLYSSAFLDKILYLSLLYLVLSLVVWWNMRKIDIGDPTGQRFFRIYIYINLMASLYFPVLMIGYKTGWYI